MNAKVKVKKLIIVLILLLLIQLTALSVQGGSLKGKTGTIKEIAPGVYLEIGSDYYLITAPLNRRYKLITTYHPWQTIEGHAQVYHKENTDTTYQFKEAIAAINGAFFWNHMGKQWISGEVIAEGEVYTPDGLLVNKRLGIRSIFRYYFVMKDSGVEQIFRFGMLEQKSIYDQAKDMKLDVGVIPDVIEESNKILKEEVAGGVGGLGLLIKNGQIAVSENRDKFTYRQLMATGRTALGINHSQDKAYLFLGRKVGGKWTPSQVADILLKKGVYNALFMDGGRGAQMWYRNCEESIYGLEERLNINYNIPNAIMLIEVGE